MWLMPQAHDGQGSELRPHHQHVRTGSPLGQDVKSQCNQMATDLWLRNGHAYAPALHMFAHRAQESNWAAAGALPGHPSDLLFHEISLHHLRYHQ